MITFLSLKLFTGDNDVTLGVVDDIDVTICTCNNNDATGKSSARTGTALVDLQEDTQ